MDDIDIKEKKKRLNEILKIFRKEYPSPKCHLKYKNPFELLIGCILSAQCTDKRVNEITPELFKKYKNPAGFSVAKKPELEKDIHSAGFFRNKAKSIINCAKGLEQNFSGKVPKTMEELTTLAGVGRKTANVILGNAYDIPGIIVDTHIKRLSMRLGLTSSKNPEKIEFDLMEIVPKKKWTYFSNALGDHGRTVCRSRRPKCDMCKINHLCPSSRL
ncbi:MAG: endonuclease III [Candidatus Dadabacteria bacterium]|nr:endonuclease III [Candidatus Dadabacteria bacterium]NIS08496.1 endonuclease III [Candidatus Dadabacteria bacterium]NIV41637.1 endonuclease III [Candidatus Dadabacteria bacterium]NIY21984.1 endonuclease III [Candidatus Dadabacteria bacterium]